MKKILTLILSFSVTASFAQNTGVGTSTPNSTFETAGTTGNAVVVASGIIVLGNFSTVIISGPSQVELPAASAANANRVYKIVNRTNAAVFTGATYLPLSGSAVGVSSIPSFTSITLQSTGIAWYRID